MKDEPPEILYEDNHLIVVNKPAGLLTQPTDLENDSLEVRVKAWIKKTYNKPGNVFLGVIHRLDKPVSGIVVFAKTSKALSRLNASIREREMVKTYYALVEGSPKKKQGTLEHYLKHDDYFASVCSPDDPSGKLARLHYEALKSSGDATLLKVVLETGRYHQIRCQCAAMGCPIVGDIKYGASKTAHSGKYLPSGAIALHHGNLTLTHPVTKAELKIEAPLPAYF
jgi:23S rRNA pseudouridine1911/1915/1917 synthase